jgi:hypothetical protein
MIITQLLMLARQTQSKKYAQLDNSHSPNGLLVQFLLTPCQHSLNMITQSNKHIQKYSQAISQNLLIPLS